MTETQYSERWRQHMPYEMTVKEIRDDLIAVELMVTERQLKDWEDIGLLPPHVRKAVPGARGHARNLYPWYASTIVAEILSAKEEGYSMAAIKVMAEGWIARERENALRLEEQGLVPEPLLRREGGPPAPRPPLALRRALWKYASRYAARTNMGAVERVNVYVDVESARRRSPIKIEPVPPIAAKRRRKGKGTGGS